MTLDETNSDLNKEFETLIADQKRYSRGLARMIFLYLSMVDMSESGNLFNQFAVVMSWALDGEENDPPPGGRQGTR